MAACDHEHVQVAVQWVRTYWTKRSRGAPGAARRNALPEALPLPDAELPFVHEIRMYESENFRPDSSLTSGLPPATEVELTEADGVLHVLLVAQNRPTAWRPAAVPLRPRQTLRWQINHRLTAEWGWYYRLDTLNVAYSTSPSEVFLHPPFRHVDERTQLP
jgi:hypothetical protein